MDIILRNAKQFADNYFQNPRRHDEIINSARTKIYDIDNPLDKIKFLNVLLDKNNRDYEMHKPKCTDPEECQLNESYETIAYYLIQELNRLGVQFNEDTFTEEDKQKADTKLEQILKDLEKIKTGQEIIYEDLLKEINELRELYFLGKKRWHQLLLGKGFEMVAAGIVSETISKDVVTAAQQIFPTIGN